MITFRFMTLEDAEMVYNWRTAEHISKYMYTKGPSDFNQHMNWISNALIDDTKIYYIIVYNEQPVGVLAFYDLDYSQKTGEWAFYIGESIAQGKGVGRVSEEFALRTIFSVMQFEKLYCGVFKYNVKVIENHQKFGFEIIGDVEGYDAVRMLMTKAIFLEKRNANK